ncbi:hypothetical protein [Streptomyces sp. NPDC048057]|uniref:imidazolonepropionase-like domain-containing protein n=1 Tax=Streptomyces sp. NPDC048057 TaxID=3155628 RepID=UPI0033FA70EB
MLTVHAADLLLPGTGPAVPGGALAVSGHEIAAIGPYEEVSAAHPQARVRRWSGTLTPGLVHPHGAWLLEHAYHPDPREADELGTEPLTGAALAALDMDDARWGASARRGVQRLLAHGVTALVGPLSRPHSAAAVARAGLTLHPGPRPSPPVPPSLHPPQDAFALTLAPGTPADFTVATPTTCLATSLAGRLVFRRA